MTKATGKALAAIAEEKAKLPYHGYADGEASNLSEITAFFPKWTPEEADGLWCAAFVYFCCRAAGFEIPIRPKEARTCHLAGCIAWEELALGDDRIEYHKGAEAFDPEPGDIVIYDRVFDGSEHDHMGIVLRDLGDSILAAEGNIHNRSGIIRRQKDAHIRGYIRLPDGYAYA